MPPEALQLLAERIVLRAHNDGVSLSQVEQTMLLFSETSPTQPEAPEVNEQFDKDHNAAGYENKISNLIRRARLADRSNSEANRNWTDSLKSLRGKDYYLLAMINQACGEERPRGDLIRLIGTAMVIVCVVVGFILFFAEG